MNKKGETIAETIVALAILAIGITLGTSIVSNGTRNIGIAKNRIVAINIAREGLEAVRNLRDTNWLKFSNHLRLCWNHQAGANGTGGDLADDSCDGTDPILPGEYVIYKNDEFGWKIAPAMEGAIDTTPLYYSDIDSLVDTDNDGDPLNDRDILNHFFITDNDSLGTRLSQSIFTRSITLEYLQNNPDPSTAPSNQSEPDDSINTTTEWADIAIDNTELNRWRVTSSVSWHDRGSLRSMELQSILTDHFGRNNLTD